MNKTRLEAFSDGVIAIIITIMVLELKVPHSPDLSALLDLLPVFMSYILSFVYVGIYWNNHHHLLHAAQKVTGATLWANMHLLFWLSIVPFTTSWMGENNFAQWPIVLYGINLFLCAVAFFILTKVLISHHDKNSKLVQALGSDIKEKISLVIYLLAMIIAYFQPWIAFLSYIVVAGIWLIPDRRIEKTIDTKE
jgi:uncharacterized membrane protein